MKLIDFATCKIIDNPALSAKIDQLSSNCSLATDPEFGADGLTETFHELKRVNSLVGTEGYLAPEV